MPVEGVAIKAHLGVKREKVAAAGDHQRVDLDKAGIKLGKGAVQAGQERWQLFCRVPGQTHHRGEAAHMVRLQPGGRIDAKRQNLLGMRFRNLLDIHAAFAGGDEGHPAVAAIDQKREIELIADLAAFLDIEALHLTALRSGLVGDKCLAEKFGGDLLHLIDRFHHLDAAGLATATGVNLRLHHIDRPAKRLCAGNSLINRESRLAARHRHAKACQQSLGLMFMNVHVIPHMAGAGPPFTLVQ